VSAHRAPAVEIVTIGNELLLGETIDSNAAWMSRTLAAAGIRVARRATVGDDVVSIRDAVAEALDRTGVVICTGGLGPTSDDLTKPVVTELFGDRLVHDEGLMEKLRVRFQERGIKMAALNRNQAEIPERATVLPNARGTAPGLALYDDRARLAILLPGVPYEMKGLMEEQVLPLLRARWPARVNPIRSHTIRTTGISESTLAERIDDVVRDLPGLTLAFLPSAHGVDLRVTSWGALDEETAAAALQATEARIRERVGDFIYATGDGDLVDAVGQRLKARGFRLSVAESCTGGLLSKRLTDLAGSSDYMLAGFITYSNEAKQKFLGVSAATLERHGAVSEQTAREMLEGARAATGAEAALSITGIAGPGGGTADKPVGTVWIGAAVAERTRVQHFRFGGDRAEIRERSAQAALAMLWDILNSSD
jgi:nicotinamide-nucleotide amidase